MKEVLLKKYSKYCSPDIGGCGRTIKAGETAYRQIRTRRKKERIVYLCKECYDRKTV